MATAVSVNAAALQELQSRARREPEAYESEVAVQLRQLSALLDVVEHAPSMALGMDATQGGGSGGGAAASTTAEALYPLLTFLGYVGATHSKLASPLAPRLAALLTSACGSAASTVCSVPPPLRLALLKCLCILRSRGCFPAEELASLLIYLSGVSDKAVRRQCHHQLVSEVRNACRGSRRDFSLSRHVRTLLRRQLSLGDGSSARRAVAVAVSLYRSGAWRDSDTIALLADAADHSDAAASRAAVRFFLGRDEEEAGSGGDDDDDDDDDEEEVGGKSGRGKSSAAHGQFVSREEVYKATKKGTVASKKKKQKKLDRAVRSLNKLARREEEGEGIHSGGASQPRFAALELLRDPQVRTCIRCSQCTPALLRRYAHMPSKSQLTSSL